MVEIKEKDEHPNRVSTPVMSTNLEEVRQGVMPAEFISKNSSYYTELAGEMFFPKDYPQWVKSIYRRDGQSVQLYLGVNGAVLDVYRNGVVM